MKRKLTLTALLLAALTAIFVLSCKKDENKSVDEPQTRGVSTTQFQRLEDIDGYLTSFKKQLADPENNVSMSIEEAAWHLAALANYDFGYFNAEHNNIRMDTLTGYINITDGYVTLADLASAYDKIQEAINSYYQELVIDNKQIHFVNTFIGDDGDVTILVTVTYSDRYHYPYYDWYIDDTIYYQNYIEGHGPFLNFGNGMQLLKYLLNLIETYNSDPNAGQIYAVPNDSVQPLPNNHLDSTGYSPNFINSRIYCTKEVHDAFISEYAMRYYLQSYHALGLSYLNNTTTLGDVITSWNIVEDTLSCDPYHPCPESINVQMTFYHQLTITYGLIASHGGGHYK